MGYHSLLMLLLKTDLPAVRGTRSYIMDSNHLNPQAPKESTPENAVGN